MRRSITFRSALLLALAAVTQVADAQEKCDVPAMRGDLTKLASGNAKVGPEWQQCLDKQDNEGTIFVALSRGRDAAEGKDASIRRELAGWRLADLLQQLKDKWDGGDKLDRFCYEVELRTYAGVLRRTTPALRRVGFAPIAALDVAMARPDGSVQGPLSVLARFENRRNPLQCLSDLDEAAATRADAVDVLTKGQGECSQVLASLRQPSPVDPKVGPLANCPTTSEPRLKSVLDAWCKQPEASHWVKLVGQLAAQSTDLLRDVGDLAGPRQEWPPSLRKRAGEVVYFTGSRPMPVGANVAVERVGEGLRALKDLRATLVALQRVRAFEAGMDLLLGGQGADRVHARLRQEGPAWDQDPDLQALDIVARYWSSGELPSRQWNGTERRIFDILGLVPPTAP